MFRRDDLYVLMDERNVGTADAAILYYVKGEALAERIAKQGCRDIPLQAFPHRMAVIETWEDWIRLGKVEAYRRIVASLSDEHKQAIEAYYGRPMPTDEQFEERLRLDDSVAAVRAANGGEQA